MSRGLIKVTATRLVGPIDVAVMAVSKHDRYELLIRLGHSCTTVVSPKRNNGGELWFPGSAVHTECQTDSCSPIEPGQA